MESILVFCCTCLLIHLAGLLLFHQKPVVHIPLLRAGIEEFQSEMTEKGLAFEMVLDGLPHSGKKASVDRANKAASSLVVLETLLRDPTSDPVLVHKLMRETRILSRPDIHACVVDILIDLNIVFKISPYEADWQLTYDCKRGHYSTVWSTDGYVYKLSRSLL